MISLKKELGIEVVKGKKFKQLRQLKIIKLDRKRLIGS